MLEYWGLDVADVARTCAAPTTGSATSPATTPTEPPTSPPPGTTPRIKGIVFARGGYGTQRMVDLLDWRRLAEGAPKVVVGFSDVTALHQAFASRLGIASVHGHVATSLGGGDEGSAEDLRRLLMEPDGIEDLLDGQSPTTWVGGVAEGVLVGGNLMMLSTDVGTPTVRPARAGSSCSKT